MGNKEVDITGRIEESDRERRSDAPCPGPNIVIEVDNEFGNMFIKVGNRMPKRSSEGMAFVTVGVDENGEVAYISIEPEDVELAKFIQRIGVR
jgi:hypothetical protein